PRVLLPHRDGQERVGLVVPVADVEPRVELLDPVVFQLQRLDLGGHHGPLDAAGAGDHLRGARVQARQVREVGVQPLAQALGLADVDDPAARVAELVYAGRVRNRAGGGAVDGWIRHTGEGNRTRRLRVPPRVARLGSGNAAVTPSTRSPARGPVRVIRRRVTADEWTGRPGQVSGDEQLNIVAGRSTDGDLAGQTVPIGRDLRRDRNEFRDLQ